MVHRKSISVFAMVLIVGASSFSTAESGIPDLLQSTASMAYQGPGPVVLFNVPNGGGSAFTEARTPVGMVDATITLILLDANGDPVVNYPAEDVWLDVDSVCPCGQWSMMANNASDANGRMSWTDPLFAGGWSNGPTVVLISGDPLMSGDIPLWHNSPDIDCNLYVNLVDLQEFTQDFFGEYRFRSDFHFDEVINLQDLAKLAPVYSASCP